MISSVDMSALNAPCERAMPSTTAEATDTLRDCAGEKEEGSVYTYISMMHGHVEGLRRRDGSSLIVVVVGGVCGVCVMCE